MDGGRADGEDHRHRVDVEDVDGADREVRPAAQAGVGQGGVDGTGGQDRRDRQPVDRPGGVGQDEEVRAAPRGGHGVAGQPIEGGLEASGPVRRIPGRVERPDRGPTCPDRVEQPVQVDDDRALEAHGPRRARQPAEQRRPPAELDPEVHDDPLALRVDRRVRDLGERLAEVVGDRPVEAAATGRRRVVAHAPERLVALERHRLDVEPGALGVEAGEVAQDVVGRGSRVRRGPRDRHRGGDPVLVDRARRVVDRQRAERPGLGLGVLEDRPPARLDEQQLARAEPAAPDGLGRGERHRAGLRGDRHEPVARHRERRRPQPVAVDQRADPPAVREHDRRRPVPRREEAGRPAAQRRDVRMRRATQRRAPRGSPSGAPA